MNSEGMSEDCSVEPCAFGPSAHDPADFVQEVEKEQVIEALYEVSPWDTWVYHIVDAAFTRAWLKHPQFLMMK